MTARTRQNLNTVMPNVALAYAKYRRFAACARTDFEGSDQVRELATFEKTLESMEAEPVRQEMAV